MAKSKRSVKKLAALADKVRGQKKATKSARKLAAKVLKHPMTDKPVKKKSRSAPRRTRRTSNRLNKPPAAQAL